jgi:hypothetical protein
MRVRESLAFMLAGLLAPLSTVVLAADYGTVVVGDSGPIALDSACAFQPRYDTQGWGKPEVTVLLASAPLDCAALAGWFNPESGAFGQAVRAGDGSLVSISFMVGMKPGKVSVYGPGYTLGNDDCDGCAMTAEYAGSGLRGTLKTGKPLSLASSEVTIDAKFDLPKPPAPDAGEALPGGGDPGKAYLAYLKAYADGDYAALQALRPVGEAEDDWGYYSDEAERKAAIQSDKKPASAKILKATRHGDSAILIVEQASPWDESSTVRAAIGLGFDGQRWRVREERIDHGGQMLGD